MKARVKWIEDIVFLGISGTGHTIVMDGSKDIGKNSTGMRPMELLLLGLGGCTAFDVVTILKKYRQNIYDCSVEIEGQRSNKIPKIFTKIDIHYKVMGKNLKEEKVKRAIELSTDKYCSASLMLGKTARINHDYKIIDSISV
ncbi:MAG: OsmC family protein [Piscirickettsiaceae bacterium]|nr:OsmC family protein [Piscirickettsiaceae bacterium]